MKMTNAKLRHTAAGLLGSFMSRNNRTGQWWALGALYSEAQVCGNRVELDLLCGRAMPEAPACSAVALTYAAFLGKALLAHGLSPEQLASATVSLAFGLPPVPLRAGDLSFGDPVDCTLTLVSQDGLRVTRRAAACCAPHASPLLALELAMRNAACRLLQLVTQPGTDGRSLLEVLLDGSEPEQVVELDLLQEHIVPETQAGTAVARCCGLALRNLLGEQLGQLGAAALLVRFSTSYLAACSMAYVETRLVTRAGRTVSSSACLRLARAAPGAAA